MLSPNGFLRFRLPRLGAAQNSGGYASDSTGQGYNYQEAQRDPPTLPRVPPFGIQTWRDVQKKQEGSAAYNARTHG